MSKNKEDDLLVVQEFPSAIYKEPHILEAFDAIMNEFWQRDDISYHHVISVKTYKKKFLLKLRNIRNNSN